MTAKKVDNVIQIIRSNSSRCIIVEKEGSEETSIEAFQQLIAESKFCLIVCDAEKIDIWKLKLNFNVCVLTDANDFNIVKLKRFSIINRELAVRNDFLVKSISWAGVIIDEEINPSISFSTEIENGFLRPPAFSSFAMLVLSLSRKTKHFIQQQQNHRQFIAAAQDLPVFEIIDNTIDFMHFTRRYTCANHVEGLGWTPLKVIRQPELKAFLLSKFVFMK